MLKHTCRKHVFHVCRELLNSNWLGTWDQGFNTNIGFITFYNLELQNAGLEGAATGCLVQPHPYQTNCLTYYKNYSQPLHIRTP